MQLNEKIHQHRKALGMTQIDLAEKLHISRQAVSRWEMGASTPDVDNLKQLSAIFSVSVDYLINDSDFGKDGSGCKDSLNENSINDAAFTTKGKRVILNCLIKRKFVIIAVALIITSIAVLWIGACTDSPATATMIVLGMLFVSVVITVSYVLIMLFSNKRK